MPTQLPSRARLGSVTVGDDHPVAVMGVINRDPNSFFRGSFYRSRQRALQAVERMLVDGASIIDIGGASTAPGAPLVSPSVEARRVSLLIREISRRWDIPISIDTQRSGVAHKALRYGATIVNDVSGLKADPAMAQVIRDTGASCILMACDQQPGDCLNMKAICHALTESLQIAINAEIPVDQIVIDPGIGFGKPPSCDLAILHNLPSLRSLRRPILVGVSRKSFIGRILGYPSPDQRLAGTLAAVSYAVLQGAHVIRAHDVRETKDCIRIIEAIHSTSRCEP